MLELMCLVMFCMIVSKTSLDKGSIIVGGGVVGRKC